MASSMGFNIFARDVSASRTFDEVGDNAERLERRLEAVGSGAARLSAKFKVLGDGASGLSVHMGGIGGAAASMGTHLLGGAAKLATLTAAAASTASSMSGLVGAVAPAAGAVAALPAAAVLGAAALTTLKVALSGVGDAFSAALGDDPKKFAEALEKLSPAAQSVAREMQALKPVFDDLKTTVQDALFAPLQGQLTGLVQTLGGPLKAGMSDLAGAFGRLGASVAAFGQSAAAVELVKGAFSTLKTEMGGLESGTLQRLLAAISNFARSTLPAFEGLGQSVNGVAERFAAFLEKATASGKSLEWVQNAFAVFKQLGAILADLGGIIAAVFRAMQTAGGGALGVLGQLLDGMHSFLDSAKGQEILVTIFTALGDIATAFLPVIKSLAGAIATLAPHIAAMATAIGPVLTTAINAIAPALAQLGPALVVVFTEFGKAVQAIAASGALDDLARAIADILIALAPLLPALAQLLVPVLQLVASLVTTVVAPALSTLVGWIQKAVDWLKGGGLSEDSWLMRVINTLWEVGAPIFKQVGDLIGTVFNDLVTWFTENKATVEEWGNRIISIIKSAGAIISGVFEGIAIAWDLFGKPLLDLIGGVFTGIFMVIDGALKAVKGQIDIFLGLITGDWQRVWKGIETFVSGIWTAIGGVITAAWALIKGQISAGLAVVGETWDSAWNKVKQIAITVWNAITGWISARVNDVSTFIGKLGELPGKVSAWFGQVKDAIVNKFNEALNFVRGIPNAIVNAFGDLGSLLYNAGRSILQGLINGLYSMLQNAYNAASDIMGQIRNLFPFSPAKEGPFSGKGWTLFSGQSMGRDLAKGIAMSENLVARAADGLMGAAAVSLSPTLNAAGGPGLMPIAPRGGDFHLHLAGSALMSRDELSRLVISALNEAKAQGFSLGFTS